MSEGAPLRAATVASIAAQQQAHEVEHLRVARAARGQRSREEEEISSAAAAAAASTVAKEAAAALGDLLAPSDDEEAASAAAAAAALTVAKGAAAAHGDLLAPSDDEEAAIAAAFDEQYLAPSDDERQLELKRARAEEEDQCSREKNARRRGVKEEVNVVLPLALAFGARTPRTDFAEGRKATGKYLRDVRNMLAPPGSSPSAGHRQGVWNWGNLTVIFHTTVRKRIASGDMYGNMYDDMCNDNISSDRFTLDPATGAATFQWVGSHTEYHKGAYNNILNNANDPKRVIILMARYSGSDQVEELRSFDYLGRLQLLSHDERWEDERPVVQFAMLDAPANVDTIYPWFFKSPHQQQGSSGESTDTVCEV